MDNDMTLDKLVDIKRKIQKLLKGSGLDGLDSTLLGKNEFLKNRTIEELLNIAIEGMVKHVGLEQRSIEGLLLIGGMFKQISDKQKGDLLSNTARLATRVIVLCLVFDIERINTDMSERLAVTMMKFCELTELDREPQTNEIIQTLKKILDKE